MNDTKLLFKLMEDGYRERRKNNNLTLEMLKGIIESYYYYVEKPVFRNLVEDYKLKYIYNEARVETNISKEEQLGLGVVYDYICDLEIPNNCSFFTLTTPKQSYILLIF